MIKAVLFDYGGVIADDALGEKLTERLAKSLGTDRAVAWGMLEPLWHQLTRGKITEQQVWGALEKQYGKPIPADMRNIWNRWDLMPRFPEMLEFVNALKASGVITGILSTTVAPTVADIRAHGGFDLFDPVILSCEVGFAKPDPEIYALAMRLLPGVSPEEVIFLDDRETSLPPARALGMHTVHVENPAQAIAATKVLLASS